MSLYLESFVQLTTFGIEAGTPAAFAGALVVLSVTFDTAVVVVLELVLELVDFLLLPELVELESLLLVELDEEAELVPDDPDDFFELDFLLDEPLFDEVGAPSASVEALLIEFNDSL